MGTEHVKQRPSTQSRMGRWISPRLASPAEGAAFSDCVTHKSESIHGFHVGWLRACCCLPVLCVQYCIYTAAKCYANTIPLDKLKVASLRSHSSPFIQMNFKHFQFLRGNFALRPRLADHVISYSHKALATRYIPWVCTPTFLQPRPIYLAGGFKGWISDLSFENLNFLPFVGKIEFSILWVPPLQETRAYKLVVAIMCS